MKKAESFASAAWAFAVMGIVWALVWGLKCPTNKEIAEEIEKTKRVVATEKSKEVQYQWKTDSLKAAKGE